MSMARDMISLLARNVPAHHDCDWRARVARRATGRLRRLSGEDGRRTRLRDAYGAPVDMRLRFLGELWGARNASVREKERDERSDEENRVQRVTPALRAERAAVGMEHAGAVVRSRRVITAIDGISAALVMSRKATAFDAGPEPANEQHPHKRKGEKGAPT